MNREVEHGAVALRLLTLLGKLIVLQGELLANADVCVRLQGVVESGCYEGVNIPFLAIPASLKDAQAIIAAGEQRGVDVQSKV